MAESERTFEMGIWSTVGTVAGLALLLTLGAWQTRRYLDKRHREQVREQRLDEPAVELDSLDALRSKGASYRRVKLRGELDTSTRLLIKHRSYNGDPGSWLVQPFHFDRGDGIILVNRGWIPFQRAQENVEPYAAPPAERPLTGLLHRLPHVVAEDPNREKLRDGELAVEGQRTEWDTFDVTAIYDSLSPPSPSEPYVVILGPNHTGDRYPIASYEHVTEPYMTSTRHLGYAAFWFAVALALVGIYVAAGFGALQSRRRGRARVPSDDGD